MTHAAAIYTRISEDPTFARLGVRRQEEDCRALVDRHEWTLAGIYEDNDVSAFSGRARPSYRRLLADVAAGVVTAIVAWDPDRLHRSPLELEEFIDLINSKGVVIATVNSGEYDLSSADGRLTARIRGSVARHESEKKSERIRRKHLELATNGKNAGGGRPFGYEPDRKTVRESEAALIREAAMRVLEGESMRSIVRDWNRRSVLTVRGSPAWSAQVLRRLLVSARISGRRELSYQSGRRLDIGRITNPLAEWPGVITVDVSDRLRVFLGDRHQQRGRSHEYLLTGGIARCGRCGEPLQAHPRSDGRTEMACVTRPGRPACGRLGVLAEPVEELVAEAIFQAVDEGALADAVSLRGEDSALVQSVLALEDRLVEAARSWANGELERVEWEAARQVLQQELQKRRKELYAGRPAAPDSLPSDLRQAWPGLPIHRRRAIVKLVIEQVVVEPAARRGGVSRFDPNRIPPGNIRWKV